MMIILIHIYVLFWALFSNLSLCGLISLSITNPEVFLNRAVNQQVYVNIAINDLGRGGQQVQLSSEDIESITTTSRVCLHLNGKPCYCVDTNRTNPISEAIIIASDDCMYNIKGFWSSIRWVLDYFLSALINYTNIPCN